MELRGVRLLSALACFFQNPSVAPACTLQSEHIVGCTRANNGAQHDPGPTRTPDGESTPSARCAPRALAHARGCAS